MANPIIHQAYIKGRLYDLADLEARGLIADIPGILTDIENLQNEKVDRVGDTVHGDLNFERVSGSRADINMNSGANSIINLSQGSKIVLNRNESTAELSSGSNLVLLKTGVDANNWRGLQVRATNMNLEYATAIEGTAKNYNIDYCYFATFSGTTLTAVSRHEYYNGTAIASLTITWPADERGEIFGVNFTSSSTFTLSHRNSQGTAFTPKYIGDDPSKPSSAYNLVCWWDGRYKWCSVKSAEA